MSAWQRWAQRVSADRLTAHQAVAVSLIQAGIARTPEAALQMLDAEKEKPVR